MQKHVLAVLGLTLTLAAPVFAAPGQVTVTWTMPTTNVDGSPLTDLAGAKIYFGASSSNYTAVVAILGGAPNEQMSVTVTGLVAGVTYYFNGAAYNTSGLESDLCAEVVKQAAGLPGTRPKTLTSLAATPDTRTIKRRALVGGKYQWVIVTQRWDETLKTWVDM